MKMATLELFDLKAEELRLQHSLHMVYVRMHDVRLFDLDERKSHREKKRNPTRVE